LFYADDSQNRATSTELNLSADSHLNRRFDLLTIQVRPKARICINDGDAAVAEAKLSVLARNHGPLLLREEVMTYRRVATYEDSFRGEGALTMQLTVAIFCENYFHIG